MAITMLAALALAAGAQMAAVHEHVQVSSQGGKVLVRLTLDNNSAKPVYVPRALYADKELFSSSFELVEQASGKALEYTGPMVKRGPLGKEDFIKVAPHGRLSNTIDITRSYGFLQGVHTYELRYTGHYVADVANINAAVPLASLKATFTHPASK
jgi:hypothetical protein